MSREIFSVGVTRLIILVMSLISLPIIIRTLGDKDYGLYVLVFGIVSLLSGISNLGLGYTAMRQLPSATSTSTRSEFFYPQFFTHVIIGISLFIFVNLISIYSPLGIYFEAKNINPVLVSLYFLLYPVYAQLHLLFKYTQKIGSLNFINICLPGTYLLALSILFYYLNEVSVNSLFKAHVISLLVSISAGWIWTRNIINFNFKSYSWQGFLIDARHGLPLLMGVVLDQITNISDRYVISFFLPLDSVGFYACASTIAAMLIIIPRVISIVSDPNISKLFDQDRLDIVSDKLSQFSNYWLAIIIPSVIGAYVLGEIFISLYISPSMGQNAGPIVWILLVGACFFGLFIIYSMALFSAKRTYILFKVSLISALFNLAFNFILLYLHQNIAMAAIATSLSYLVMFSLVTFYGRDIILLKFDLNEIIKILGSSIVGGFSIWYATINITNEVGVLKILYLIIQFMIFYILSLVLFNSKLTKIKLLN